MTVTTKLTERVGQMLKGRYRVHQVLHTGVRATVYAGLDQKSGRVAIKVFDSAPDANVLHDSYLANAVGHPGAVNVLDTGCTEDGVAFLVMELLEATSMRQLLFEHEGHLPVRLACTIADQGLDLLASAHAQRIAHGELELDKLFFTRTQRVKLLGFGKQASEQAALDDVRALSKAIAWLLCGEPVDSLQAAPSASAIPPRLPARIAAVLERGLTTDPAQRWKSANAMRTALQLACKAELGRPIDRSLQPLAATKTTRPSRRVMWLAAAGALVMALYVAREVAELRQVEAPEAEPETDITSALQPPQAKAQADEAAPQQAAASATEDPTSHTDGQSSVEATRSPEASPARHMPRKPNRPELRSLSVQRKSAIPTNIAPVSEVCAELSSARRARQLNDREAQVYLSRCTKH